MSDGGSEPDGRLGLRATRGWVADHQVVEASRRRAGNRDGADGTSALCARRLARASPSRWRTSTLLKRLCARRGRRRAAAGSPVRSGPATHASNVARRRAPCPCRSVVRPASRRRQIPQGHDVLGLQEWLRSSPSGLLLVQRLVSCSGRLQLSVPLSHRPLLGGSVQRHGGPASRGGIADVDEQSVLIVFDSHSVLGVRLFMEPTSPFPRRRWIGNEGRPSTSSGLRTPNPFADTVCHVPMVT